MLVIRLGFPKGFFEARPIRRWKRVEEWPGAFLPAYSGRHTWLTPGLIH